MSIILPPVWPSGHTDTQDRLSHTFFYQKSSWVSSSNTQTLLLALSPVSDCKVGVFILSLILVLVVLYSSIEWPLNDRHRGAKRPALDNLPNSTLSTPTYSHLQRTFTFVCCTTANDHKWLLLSLCHCLNVFQMFLLTALPDLKVQLVIRYREFESHLRILELYFFNDPGTII